MNSESRASGPGLQFGILATSPFYGVRLGFAVDLPRCGFRLVIFPPSDLPSSGVSVVLLLDHCFHSERRHADVDRDDRFCLVCQACRDTFGGPVSIVLNIGRYTGILVEIWVFYPKRYDKCKILSDIILDRYEPIYRHVAIYRSIFEMKISDISSRNAFEELLQTHLKIF